MKTFIQKSNLLLGLLLLDSLGSGSLISV